MTFTLAASCLRHGTRVPFVIHLGYEVFAVTEVQHLMDAVVVARHPRKGRQHDRKPMDGPISPL